MTDESRGTAATKMATGRAVLASLEGPDGCRTGSNTQFADEAETGYGSEVLTGHGDYEGLSAFLRRSTDDPDCIECLTAHGYICEREMTPLPAPLEPSAG